MTYYHLTLILVAVVLLAAVAPFAIAYTYRQWCDRRDAVHVEHQPRHALVAPWDDPELVNTYNRLDAHLVDTTFDARPWLYDVADEAGTLDPDLTATAFDRRNVETLRALLAATEPLAITSGRELVSA